MVVMLTAADVLGDVAGFCGGFESRSHGDACDRGQIDPNQDKRNHEKRRYVCKM